MAEGGYPNKIKRPCLEDVTLSLGPRVHPGNPCPGLQVPPLAMNPGSAGPPLLLENNPLNGSALDSPFVVPPAAEMGLKGPAGPCYDKVSSMPAVDQELQDLLEELTKIPEPSSSELDLEKILGRKPEEPLLLDHPQATLGTAPKGPAQLPHLGKEFASTCSRAVGTPLPTVPCCAGLGYTLPSGRKQALTASSATAQATNQGSATLPTALPPRPVPQWHHAHQLKVLAASKQGAAPSWSGLPAPGLSPPYRPAPSPQPLPPFGPPSLLASCMAPSSLAGSTLPGSPGASLSSMATGSGSTLGPAVPCAPEKLPQPPPFSPQGSTLANLMSSTSKTPPGHLLPALPTSKPGPSPPYRPEQLSSPGLPQQSFTPQCCLAQALVHTSSPLSQQQQQRASASFRPMTAGSPRTLSVIMQQGLAGPGPAAPEPFTFGNTKPLSHFVSEPGPEKTASMPAASRQPSLLHYLQQPIPSQAPAAMATATATLQQQQQPDHASLLLQQMVQQPQCLQRAAALDAMAPLPRQQEKQSSGLTAVTPEQRTEYLAQQMRQFQAVQEEVTSTCSCSRTSCLSRRHSLTPRVIPSAWHQGVASPNPPFPGPTRSGQSPPASAGPIDQCAQSPRAASWVAAAVTAAVSRGPALSHVDGGRQQRFESTSIFAKAPPRAPLGALACPSQQAAVVPSQMAPGGRPSRKVSATLAHPHFSLLGVPKSLRQGSATFSPLSPIQGIEPPSYMSSAAATATASAVTASLSPGPFDRMGTPPELPPPSSVTVSPDRTGPDEDWVCNLRLIDDILEQHAAAQNAAAQSAGLALQAPPEHPHVDASLSSHGNP